MTGLFFFRKPPAVLGTHNFGGDAGKNPGALPNFSPDRFDNDPIAFFNTLLGGSKGMDLHNRVPMKFPQPGHLAVFGVKKPGQPCTGDQDIGVLFM